MHSLASAARLLSACTRVDRLPPLLLELGFSQTLAPLTSDAFTVLELPANIRDVRISKGGGSLRALCFEITTEGHEMRSTIQRVASRLASRLPQHLWLIVALDVTRGELSISAFDDDRPRPRIAALVTRLNDIVDSDSETVCSLAATASNGDVVVHARWIEILGRETINRRFFHDLERLVGQLAASLDRPTNPEESSELALLYVSRLLFLSFLETKGWLNRDHGFLSNQFADCMLGGGSYHRKVLNPLFFGTLNTRPACRAKRAREFGRVPFLNGGLFSKAAVEKRIGQAFFSDEALGDVFGDLLSRYRFTAREDAALWSEAAVDPEMLGKAFESLMSSRNRKRSGAFYTPQSLVRDVSRSALAYGIESREVNAAQVFRALEGEIASPGVRTYLLERTSALRVLDPACGSGAFLVFLLEEISALRVRLGDLRPANVIRRDVLTRSIYGVDLNPMAVWLCELRLWLSTSIEDPETDPMRVVPLPNLDRNIRLGDSLSGDDFHGSISTRSATRIARLRLRYARSAGPRKRSLARALDLLERQVAVATLERKITTLQHHRRDLISALRSPDLFGEKGRRDKGISVGLVALKREVAATKAGIRDLKTGAALPFSFSSGFADAAADGGFDIIAGNPPWIRIHNLEAHARLQLRERYFVYRNSAWLGGSEAAAAGRGFSSQIDASALFAERCSTLLKPGGTMALILPAKLWRSLAGGGVRDLLLRRTSIREIDDLTNAPQLFAAAVYPSVVVASRIESRSSALLPGSCVEVTTHFKDRESCFRIATRKLPLDESIGSPWLVVPTAIRMAFDALKECGTPMSQSCFGRPLLGVKTGCNEAFVVDESKGIESTLLRPALRGDQIRPWKIDRSSDRIIWTHDAVGPMRTLPARAAHHLQIWRRTLELRSDMRGKSRWWMLFRTESADSSHSRVVWSDIGKRPRAVALPAGDLSVPLNTCYVARCPTDDDAHALAAILNSLLAASWLDLLAEPARGGYRRYMGWTMAMLPIPMDWTRARGLLAPLSKEAIDGRAPSDNYLLNAVLDAYDIHRSQVAPLIEWSS